MRNGRLAIFGANDHGRVVAEIALTLRWEAVFFYDGRFSKNTLVDSHSVIRYLKNLACDGESYQGFRVAIGANNIRFALVEKLKALGECLPHIIHPSAIISGLVSLDYGVCMLPNVIVNAGNKIGGDSVIGAGSVVIKNVPDDVT